MEAHNLKSTLEALAIDFVKSEQVNQEKKGASKE